ERQPPPSQEKPTESQPWTEYTQDVFGDASAKWKSVIWRWHYKPEIDQTPRNITPCCPDCDKPTPLDVSVIFQKPKVKGDAGSRLMICRTHKQVYTMPARWGSNLEQYADVRELIGEKLQDGSWVEVVNRQR